MSSKKTSVWKKLIVLPASGVFWACSAGIPANASEVMQDAKSQMAEKAISKDELYEQLMLTYDENTCAYVISQFTTQDWRQEAMEAYEQINAQGDLSEKAIEERLAQARFSDHEIEYALQTSASQVDYAEHALLASIEYLSDESTPNHPKGLKDYLTMAHFTTDQIHAAMEDPSIVWTDFVMDQAQSILSTPCSQLEVEEILKEEEFKQQDIFEGLESLSTDWNWMADQVRVAFCEENCCSRQEMIQALEQRKFTTAQIEDSMTRDTTDWNHQAYKAAALALQQEKLDITQLSMMLKEAGFESDQIDYVLACYQESDHCLDLPAAKSTAGLN